MTGDRKAANRGALVAVVLTRDEEANLPSCLASLSGLDSGLFVVDSGSTDGTTTIARRAGATVLSHPFEGHARQWRWAIDNRPLDAEWILGIDADQRLTPELRNEISVLLTDPARMRKFDGYYVNRRHIFRGRWLRHGGLYPKYLLKLFRADRVALDEADLVDHHFYVSGATSHLRGELIEENRKDNDLSFWIAKHVNYATRHAREEMVRRHSNPHWVIHPNPFGTPDQRAAWLKEYWFRMPLYVRPILYFCYRYAVLGGFRDGRQGFLFHFLQALWYRELVDAQLDQLLLEQSCFLRKSEQNMLSSKTSVPLVSDDV